MGDILAAANMRRLLEAYRNLAPLTIGGPSSTSLETPGTNLSTRPHAFPDPRLLRKFAHYPWLLGQQGGHPGLPQHLLAKGQEERRRHASCDSLLQGGRLQPTPPIFTSKDRESSRFVEGEGEAAAVHRLPAAAPPGPGDECTGPRHCGAPLHHGAPPPKVHRKLPECDAVTGLRPLVPAFGAPES